MTIDFLTFYFKKQEEMLLVAAGFENSNGKVKVREALLHQERK